MVDFRRCFTALALLVLFVGLAGAQVTVNSPLQCAVNVSVTPTLRSEGYTEQTGDITLTCTGGVVLVPGSVIPQVNISLSYNTQVTSRLLPVTSVSNNISEALLILDEPGSGLPGYGPSLTQKLCPTPLTGCVEYVGTNADVTLGTAVDSCKTFSGLTCAGTSSVFGANVFQGVVSSNQITFFGVPILAPVTPGVSRVIRITNARVNATSLSGGSAAGATPVIASISTNGATSLLITNPTPTVGFVQSGLTATASGATNQNQCTNATRVSINTLTFSENFPTAFKTRVAAQNNNTLYAGQAIPGGPPTNQNVPGSIYNSESNFVFPVNASQTAGLADFGTRLRAVFNNVPAGVRIFVSTINVNNNASPVATPAVPGGSVQNTIAPFAQFVGSNGTVGDGNAGIAGFFPAVASTDFGPNNGNVPIAEVTIVNGSGTAVWEIVNTNPNTNEQVKFAVYDTFTANVAQNSPPPGTATVSLSFAPAPPDFSASAAAAASSSLVIPRFIADPNAAKNIATILICRTILLYPYVINVQGFDTGLAIANTSTDPFGTGPQAGSCKLNWYQGATNPAQGDTGTIASGTVYTTLASTAVPGFAGYMIAVCNFQYAHGFAFVSDVGARNLAMGYLALIIPDPGTGSRPASPLSAAGGGTGESIAH